MSSDIISVRFTVQETCFTKATSGFIFRSERTVSNLFLPMVLVLRKIFEFLTGTHRQLRCGVLPLGWFSSGAEKAERAPQCGRYKKE